MFVRDENEVLDGGGLFQEFGSFRVGEWVLRAGVLDEGELRGGGGGGDDDAAAGVFAIEPGQGISAEFGFVDGLDDFCFVKAELRLAVARGCSRRAGGGGSCGRGGTPGMGTPGGGGSRGGGRGSCRFNSTRGCLGGLLSGRGDPTEEQEDDGTME